MEMMRVLSGLCLVGVLGVACDKGADQAKLDEAKREAATKVADAEREAADKKAAAERDLAETKAKAEGERAEARTALQKELAASDRKVADLKARAAKANGKVKLNAQAAAVEYDKRHAVAERSLSNLNSATGDAWEGLKTSARNDVDAVKTALDSFDTALGH